MSDAGIFLVNGCFDVKIENNDLVSDEGLETAISISLFTDQRVTDEELPFGFDKKRGWWGDSLAEVDKDQIGSKMWLLDRGKRTQTELNELENYARQSLQWLIEDGITNTIEVTGEFDSSGQTIINVSITRPNENETRYSVLWDAQEIRRS